MERKDCSYCGRYDGHKPNCKKKNVSAVASNVGLSCVWVNVKERLPEPGQIVLWWNDDYRMIEFGSSGSFNGENVTYWMPLPEPPPAR
jgi:hypothetical protein